MILLKDMESFDQIMAVLAMDLEHYGRQVNRGEWQAKSGTDFDTTIGVEDVSLEYDIPSGIRSLQAMVQPNLPWAEDHFQERISGHPMNPPPSHEWWPFNQNGNADHLPDGETFSHTYPERFWAHEAMGQVGGIRFMYGDLNDLIALLVERPDTRQAYLPIWFPEDLSAARLGERVPCTLGYHFLLTNNRLSVKYYMRSCDYFRYLRDDAYMAARLVQHITDILNTERVMDAGHEDGVEPIVPGRLVMHISNLHVFGNERPRLKDVIGQYRRDQAEAKTKRLLEGGW